MRTKWLMQQFPPLATADGGPDERAYQGLFDPFYRGAFDAGRQVRILHVDQWRADPDRHRVLVVPGLYIADDATLDALLAYAAGGGHLVLGPRTGYADEEARARTDVMPARLAEAAGVRYDEFSNIDGTVGVAGLLAGGATRWIDGLEPTGAEVLARYEHPHFGRWPAVTTHPHGAGRITYVGTVPDPTLAAALIRRLVPADRPLVGSAESVTTTSATARDGRRVHVAHNWSWEPATVRPTVAVHDVLSGDDYEPAGEIGLTAWDVRVLVER